ncbi:MAG: DNA repair protein RecO [Acidobacteriota bacterium]
MGLHQTDAFILRTYPLAEAHKICVLLTRDSGLIRGVAHGARRLKSRFGASLEPFTEIHLTYYEKEGRELVRVSNCDIIRSHFLQASKTEIAAALSYITELLCEFLPAHEPNERLYRLVLASLEALETDTPATATTTTTVYLDSLLRYFEIWLLKLSGFFPDLQTCVSCNQPIETGEGVWLAADGTPQCYKCSGGRGTGIGNELKRTLTMMLQYRPSAFAAAAKPYEHLAAIGEISYRLIRRILERDLRSYTLMNQVQAEMRRG